MKPLILKMFIAGMLAFLMFGSKGASGGEVKDAWLSGVEQMETQSRDAKEARNCVRDAYNQIVEQLARLDEMQAAGQFDLIPTIIKQTMQAARTALTTAKTTIEANANVMELFDDNIGVSEPE